MYDNKLLDNNTRKEWSKKSPISGHHFAPTVNSAPDRVVIRKPQPPPQVLWICGEYCHGESNGSYFWVLTLSSSSVSLKGPTSFTHPKNIVYTQKSQNYTEWWQNKIACYTLFFILIWIKPENISGLKGHSQDNFTINVLQVTFKSLWALCSQYNMIAYNKTILQKVREGF